MIKYNVYTCKKFNIGDSLKIPILSIIIPTHNSELTIENCINSLTSQSYPREKFEIIVVDDGSTDNTTRIAKNAGADRIIITEPCFQGKARNIGVENANAHLLGFIDSDCEAKDDWVKTIVKELETLHAISGPIENGNPYSKIAWAEYFVEFCAFNEFRKRMIIRTMPGCNIACSKEVFTKAGGFSEEPLSEDIMFGQCLRRKGFQQFFVPELQIRHLCRTDSNKFLDNHKLLGRYFVRNRKSKTSEQSKLLINSIFFIPIIFLGKFFKSVNYSIKARKTRKFFSTLPWILKGNVAYCKGILQEINIERNRNSGN